MVAGRNRESEMTLTVQEQLDYIQGQMEVLAAATTALMASHPHALALHKMIKEFGMGASAATLLDADRSTEQAVAGSVAMRNRLLAYPKTPLVD